MLMQYSDKWMKQTWLPEITTGEMPFATAVSEPARGSNIAGMETRAQT
jgi:alkylation response protein AidB-like acyl-CoA dehydrogenase